MYYVKFKKQNIKNIDDCLIKYNNLDNMTVFHGKNSTLSITAFIK